MVYLSESSSAKNGTGPARPQMTGSPNNRTSSMDSNNRQTDVGSGAEDDSDDREGRIRVGKDYQVNPPNFIPVKGD